MARTKYNLAADDGNAIGFLTPYRVVNDFLSVSALVASQIQNGRCRFFLLHNPGTPKALFVDEPYMDCNEAGGSQKGSRLFRFESDHRSRTSLLYQTNDDETQRPSAFLLQEGEGLSRFTDTRQRLRQDRCRERLAVKSVSAIPLFDLVDFGVKGYSHTYGIDRYSKDRKLYKYGLGDFEGGYGGSGWDWTDWCLTPEEAFQRILHSELDLPTDRIANPVVYEVETEIASCDHYKALRTLP